MYSTQNQMSLHDFLVSLLTNDVVTIMYEYLRTIRVEEERALLHLIPLVVNDGELHKTDSLPVMVYDTPNHLDFVCRYLNLSISKFQRMARICRLVEYNPKSKIQVHLKDESQRMSYRSIPWATACDEKRIEERFQDILFNTISDLVDTVGMMAMGFRVQICPAKKRRGSDPFEINRKKTRK